MIAILNDKKYRPGEDDIIDTTILPVVFNYRDLYLPTRAEILGDDNVIEHGNQEE